jgi:nucleoside-diphosphate-sugar epimerase
MEDSVLVTGASSQLGVFLLPRLQAAGFRVLAFSRRAPTSAFDVTEQVSWCNPGPIFDEGAEVERLPSGLARHLVSCGPLDLANSLIIEDAGLERVVAFSTSSVLTKSGSANRVESGHMVEIREQEQRLKKLCDDRGISLVLLRPTMIYGCGLDRNISMLARFGRKFGFIPLASKACGLRQPVHADDLAAVAVHALSIENAITLESVACGGSTLTYREMVERIARCCDERVRVRALPPWLMAAAVRVASLLPAFRAVNIEMVRRQGRDMVFDDTPLREALDYRPRPFEPCRADFQVPENAAKLQLPAQVA